VNKLVTSAEICQCCWKLHGSERRRTGHEWQRVERTNKNTTHKNWNVVDLVLPESAAFLLLASPFIMKYSEQRTPQRALCETCARPSPRTASSGHGCMLEAKRVSRHESYTRGCHIPELARMQQRRHAKPKIAPGLSNKCY
jgi:hypothetical protein